MRKNLNVFNMFPSTESAGRRFAFLHRVLRGEFPCFDGTIKALRLPAAHPTALRFLRLAVPRMHSLKFAPRRTSAPSRPGVVDPVSPPGNLPRKRQELPSSWGISIVRLHMFRDAGRTARTRPFSAAAWPLVCEQQRLPRKVFRRSMAWLSDSLSTLRRGRYLPTTQDSLPVASQALPEGLSTRKIPTKGFKAVHNILSPLPKLLGTITSTRAVFCKRHLPPLVR